MKFENEQTLEALEEEPRASAFRGKRRPGLIHGTKGSRFAGQRTKQRVVWNAVGQGTRQRLGHRVGRGKHIKGPRSLRADLR